MKMILAQSTTDGGDVGDVAFFLNEFRLVYFAYLIPPTKTRLSVFSFLVGAEEEIFWL